MDWLEGLFPGWDVCGDGDDDDTVDDDDSADDDDTTGDDDSGDDDATGDDDTTGNDQNCDRYNTLGRFTLAHPPDLESWLRGQYLDAPDPMTPDELLLDGDCSFFDFDPMPSCDPPCEYPEMCGFGSECHPLPATVDVGTVSVNGTIPPLEADISCGCYSADTGGYPDLYQPGDPITLSASGSENVGPFDLTVEGVAPLTPSMQSLTMELHQDMVITWDPAPVPADSRIFVRFNAHHHAGYWTYVECEVEDSAGSLVVPASVVDALLEAAYASGWFDVEDSYMLRLTRSVEETDLGCVEFASVSKAYLTVMPVWE